MSTPATLRNKFILPCILEGQREGSVSNSDGTEKLYGNSSQISRNGQSPDPMLLSSAIFQLFLFLSSFSWTAFGSKEDVVREFFANNGDSTPTGSTHTNNWAVLVCASKYWFNYRVRVVILWPRRQINECIRSIWPTLSECMLAQG